MTDTTETTKGTYRFYRWATAYGVFFYRFVRLTIKDGLHFCR